MPVDPSVWQDGRLAAPVPSALNHYGWIPPSALDWTQDVHDRNAGTPEAHDLRWRLSELHSEGGDWEDARARLVEEIREAFHGISLPTVAEANSFVDVLEWSRDEKVRNSVENASDGWPSLLFAEILQRAPENWADPAHARVLAFLSERDPARGGLVRAALPGCRDVVLRWDLHGEPTASVALNPATLHLEYREYATDRKSSHTYVAYRSDIVPTSFVVSRHEDQAGVDWYEWERRPNLDGRSQLFRCHRQDLIESVRSSYRPSSAMMRGLGAWLERLPPTGVVRTRLSLEGPRNRANITVGWWIPSVFGRQVEGRTDAAGILASWYRPRTKEMALERMRKLLSFASSDKLRAILCYVAGAPIFAKLAPDRPLPYLELVGESRTGKTHTTRAAIAVLWGLGDGYREYIGGDVLHSGFRRSDFLSATDLPILVDESSLSRSEREHMRAAANGSLTTRGGTDLLHRGYAATAPVIFTCNASPDDSDSSSAERHGDERRRLRIAFDDTDRIPIQNEVEEFTRWLRTLPADPLGDPEKDGGAVLHLLNEATDRGGDLSKLRGVIDGAQSEQEAILSLGATLLGIPPVRLRVDDTDQAAETFLEWLRVEAGTWLKIKTAVESGRGPAASTSVLQRLIPLDDSLRPVGGGSYIRAVYVTGAALEEYKAHRRRVGSSSPYHRISDLATLASVTGQKGSDIIGSPENGRSLARGLRVRIDGSQIRAALVRLPDLKDGEEGPLPKGQRTIDPDSVSADDHSTRVEPPLDDAILRMEETGRW